MKTHIAWLFFQKQNYTEEDVCLPFKAAAQFGQAHSTSNKNDVRRKGQNELISELNPMRPR